MVPSFSTFNAVGGMFISGLVMVVAYYSRVWNTAYLPINTNRIYDHFGKLYNVSLAIDEYGMYDEKQYVNYSAPYMTIASCLIYGAFFALYSAVLTHVALYHRHEIALGMKSLWKSLRKSLTFFTKAETSSEKTKNEEEFQDVHNRLMAAYPEGEPLNTQHCAFRSPFCEQHCQNTFFMCE